MGGMKMIMPEKIFVTGTDTGVGKTLICAILMILFDSSCYWKPIQTGSEEGTDRAWIKNSTGLPEERFFPEVYNFKKPLSPHAASVLENTVIDLSSITVPETKKRLIVEGAGGVMVPLNDREFMLDLMKHLGFPVLIVCRSTLGTINHTLLTITALRSKELDVIGVIMNGPLNESNRKAIEYYGRVPVIGQVEPLSVVTPETLRKAASGWTIETDIHLFPF